jgi:hypothetical protein
MAEADWKARVVWVPKAIRYNEPESPNVIKGWRKAWDEIPECHLKLKSLQELRDYVESNPKHKAAWLKAFREVFPEAFAKGSPNQEQEQEQEINTPQPPKGETGSPAGKREPQSSPKRADGSEFSPGFMRFWSEYPAHERKVGKSACARLWKRKKLEAITEQVIASLERCKASRDWTKNGGEFIPGPASWLNKTPWETDPAETRGLPTNGEENSDPSLEDLPWIRNRGVE